MIPAKLSLRNFMCYKDNVPEISFENIHTACISGNNGNGKSALIDAITWALWGKTRATSDDDLIHTGKTETEVIFEFIVNDARYRIIRKRIKPKTSKGVSKPSLDLQLVTPEGIKVLSGESIGQTQEEITRILHMDYETFINSAFLRQGHADEFTKKRPAERKQVLASIMQLSIYDELEEAAKEKVKNISLEKNKIDAFIEAAREELDKKHIYQSEYEEADKNFQQAEQETIEKEKILNSLRDKKEILGNKKAELSSLQSSIKETEHNLNQWKNQLNDQRLRIQKYEKLISQRNLIEEKYARFIKVEKSLQDMQSKLKHFNALQQKKHQAETAIFKASQELNNNHSVTCSRIEDYTNTSSKLVELQTKGKKLSGQLQDLEQSEKELQEMRDESKSLHNQIHSLQTEIKRIHEQTKEIDEKLNLLSHEHEDGLKCPLCESDLGEEGQKRIQEKYSVEKGELEKRAKEAQTELKEKENEVKKIDNDIQMKERELRRYRETLTSQIAVIKNSIEEAQDAGSKLEKEKQALQEIEQQISARDFAHGEQNLLKKVEQEIEETGYDEKKHEEMDKQYKELEQYEEPYRKLDEALRLIEGEKEQVKISEQNIAELEVKRQTNSQKAEELNSEIKELDVFVQKIPVAESEYRNCQKTQQNIREQLTTAQAHLKRLEEIEEKYNEHLNKRKKLENEESIYNDLSQAFGKKGIQAMLIDMALPEIENEANRLLSRMTDGRMSVKFETQRETKKGDVLETLDINISDELGTRNYEMFSGGEAFRINFAIRIALSRLLAHRAGAALPTLIIDEGFGTQDSTGIEKIKEAITSIQDDFEKILVITHILDFKDAFPLRIEVVKTEEGSNIYLN